MLRSYIGLIIGIMNDKVLISFTFSTVLVVIMRVYQWYLCGRLSSFIRVFSRKEVCSWLDRGLDSLQMDWREYEDVCSAGKRMEDYL